MTRNKVCLGYKQAYEDLNTKAFQFQNFSLTRTSAMLLEGLRDLTVLREAAVGKPPAEEVGFDERLHRLEKYLRLLHNFVDKAGELMDAAAQTQLSFEWCIPQISSPSFHSWRGVQLELALVLLLYAAALRQQADAASLRICDSAAEEAEDFATAAKLFQKAAGVLVYVSDNLLRDTATGAGKAAQSLPYIVKAMTQCCLGEAQAVFASRAEARGSSSSLIAALHCGASDLFEAAALELRPNPSSVASQRFRMLLALSSELHKVRARRHIAAQQSREGHPGASCADLLDAEKRVADTRAAVETELRWKDIFNKEQQEISAKMPLYEQERQVVSIERIAPHRSKAPESKILAKPAPYEPMKMTVEVF